MHGAEVIPAEAVEALAAVLAQESLVSADMDGCGWDAENDSPEPFMPRARERALAYLEAAAPYIIAAALRDAADHLEYGNPINEWLYERADEIAPTDAV